ncbi:MAG: hypothetical protein E6Q90_13320 [Actinobacteria bacterium]|nr:MAG: hypothetical protein E6Q90_13320 [Actinomycetota bacterium]
MSGSAAGHVEAAPPVLPEPVTPRRGQDRWALLAFVLIAVLGFLIYTFVLGADVYIGIDDLLVYTSRSGGVLNSLLQPYTTHLVALPFSIEWVIVELFGLTGGVPFAAVAAGAWIAGASLVRVIARQSGVDSWIATIVAASVVICGAIYPYNQPHTLQVPLAVALGLGQVAVANGRRWDTPRMAATIALTVLALSTSAVAMSFVAATALVLWARRGLKTAVVVVVPPVLLFAAWYLAFGTGQLRALPGPPVWQQPPSLWLGWMEVGYRAAFQAIGGWLGVGVALAVVAVVGGVLAWQRAVDHVPLVAPVALAGAGFLHLVNILVLRYWFGAQGAGHSRIAYVTVLTLLPLLAVAFDALARAWRPLGLLVLLLIVPLPLNVAALREQQAAAVLNTGVQAQSLAILAESPQLDSVPGWVRPHPIGGFVNGLASTDVELLRRLRDTGRVPTGTPPSDGYAAQVPVRLGVAVRDEGPPATTRCRLFSAPTVLDEPVGYRFTVAGATSADTTAIDVGLVDDERSWVTFTTAFPGETLPMEVVLPGPYVVRPHEPTSRFRLCPG